MAIDNLYQRCKKFVNQMIYTSKHNIAQNSITGQKNLNPKKYYQMIQDEEHENHGQNDNNHQIYVSTEDSYHSVLEKLNQISTYLQDFTGIVQECKEESRE